MGDLRLAEHGNTAATCALSQFNALVLEKPHSPLHLISDRMLFPDTGCCAAHSPAIACHGPRMQTKLTVTYFEITHIMQETWSWWWTT